MNILIRQSIPCIKTSSKKKIGFTSFWNTEGSITVFISLCLSVCMLLIGTALESARYLVLKAQAYRAAESALDSVFASFDGDLFDEFGILALNTEDLPRFSSLEELTGSYLERELDAKAGHLLTGGNFLRETLRNLQIVESTPIVLRNGKLFGRSALDYMKYCSSAKLMKSVASQLRELAAADTKKLEIEEGSKKAQEAADQAITEAEVQGGTEDSEQQTAEGGYDEEKYREAIEESALGKIEEIQKNGALGLILPPGAAVSEKFVTKMGFPSVEWSSQPQQGTSILSEAANKILFSEYILEHFYGFTDGKGNENLQYELEYILSGNGRDRKNLEECIKQLLLMREGMNLVAVYSNKTLNEQAELFASGLVGWTGLWPVVQTVKAATAAAWAYGEAILDVRTLLGGGKVPLMKKEGEWTLGLAQLPDLAEGKLLTGGSYEEGMEYSDYLRLLLLAVDEQKKYYRAMDMIQCRLADYKRRFYLKECIYEMQIKAVIEAKPLFFIPFGVQSGLGKYSITVFASRMY